MKNSFVTTQVWYGYRPIKVPKKNVSRREKTNVKDKDLILLKKKDS